MDGMRQRVLSVAQSWTKRERERGEQSLQRPSRRSTTVCGAGSATITSRPDLAILGRDGDFDWLHGECEQFSNTQMDEVEYKNVISTPQGLEP